ncbi:MAG: outer membrane protein transport protein [Ferrimonas sp.]
MKRHYVSALVAMALMGQAQAAGFQLAEYSATGLGRAYAGEAAMADNASSQGRNPALLAALDGQQLSGGLVYINPNINVTGSVTSPFGQELPASAKDYAPSAFLPNLYYSHRLSDNVGFGVAFTASHGMSTTLAPEHAAAIFGSDVGIEVLELVPAMAYQITPSLALGAGIRVIYGKGHVTATAPSWAEVIYPVGRELKSVEGDGFDVGYQLGATWAPVTGHRLGVSYRSGVDLVLKGDASGIAFGEQLSGASSTPGSLTLPLPATAELASVHQLTEQLALHGSINWTDWSAFKTLTVDFPASDSVKLKEEHFKDNWRYAVGLSYQVAPALLLRAGAALDKGAVSDEFRTVSIPDSDRIWLSAGMSYQVSSQWNVDLALTHIKARKASIEESESGAHYRGEMSGEVFLVGLQASYRF